MVANRACFLVPQPRLDTLVMEQMFAFQGDVFLLLQCVQADVTNGLFDLFLLYLMLGIGAFSLGNFAQLLAFRGFDLVFLRMLKLASVRSGRNGFLVA